MRKEYISVHFLFIVLLGLCCTCSGENVKKSIDENRDDTGDVNDEAKDESLDIPVESESTTNQTCSRRLNSQLHAIRSAVYKQFPFIGAVMSHQNEYLCAGSVIANGLILTTAKCTLQPISYVLLNTTSDKKDDNTVMLHVIKTDKFPTFIGTESLKNVGLIYTEKHNNSIASKIKISNFTNARSIEAVEGIGFGLNAEIGQPRELQYIGMEVRAISETEEVMPAFFDCVESKVPTCFKDTGSPVIFDNELIGIVIKGQEDCTKQMSATYAINKKMADILPTYTFKAWLDERIQKNNEESGPSDDPEIRSLATYPSEPSDKTVRMKAQLSNALDNELSKAESVLLATPIPIIITVLYLLVI